MNAALTASVTDGQSFWRVIGHQLSDVDFKNLEARWIDRQSAVGAGLTRVDSFTGAEVLGRTRGDYEGVLIPYYPPGSTVARGHRLRRDRPDYQAGTDGQLKATGRYLSPSGRGNMIYFPAGCEPAHLSSLELPLIITEGEFKTIALWRLANWITGPCPRFLPIGLSGVANWRGVIGKATTPDGQRADIKGALPDWSWLILDGRQVIIAYDSDLSSKEQVRRERGELARYLRQKGALVGFLEWDPSLGKGIDDHLAVIGHEAALGEISRVSFAYDWRVELIRSAPSPKYPDGKILPLLANANAALRHAPQWAGVLAFNEFSFVPIAMKPAPWGVVRDGIWTDQEDRLTADWLQHQGILVDIATAGQAVQTACRDRSFHPVRKYLDSLHWDHVKRLDTWLSTYLGVDDTPYCQAVGSRWLMSAVARIYHPGAKADCCLILEGPQGIRKSTALRTLAGPYFTDQLPDIGSKDASLHTQGVWIIELSELDKLRRSEVSQIKAFFSRESDHFRPPYGKRSIDVPRQCIFAGTVNDSTYLRDETGNRRFWPVLCSSINIDRLEADRDQLWAEAKARFESGSKWWLETNDLVTSAAEEQAHRYEEDPWQELIEGWLGTRTSSSVSEVLLQCLDKPKANWTQADQNRVARCFISLRWERKRERIPGQPGKYRYFYEKGTS